MDVEDLVAPAIDEVSTQQPHEPGQTDELRARLDDGLVQRLFELFARAKVGVVDHLRWDAKALAHLQPAGVRPVGYDRDNFTRMIR